MSLNVLVVDDSAVMRQMVIRTLRMCGLPLGEVHEAANGLKGLQAIADHWIDLLLVDMNMPGMDGAEMIGRLRSESATRDLPVLIISTSSSESLVSSFDHHHLDFIAKPFTPESLQEKIVTLTGVRHEEHASAGSLPDSGSDF